MIKVPSSTGQQAPSGRQEANSSNPLRRHNLSWDEIEGVAKGLLNETARLRNLSRLLFMVTFLHLLVSVVSVTTHFFPGLVLDVKLVYVVSLYSLSFCFLACSLFIVWVYETGRKQGQIVYQQLSNELQMRVEFPYDYRVALRSWSAVEDLPLVPGRFGPLAYFLFHLFLTAVVFLVVSTGGRFQ
jgi:hypothetical protein